MQEPIDFLLQMVGYDLTFFNGQIIKAIPGLTYKGAFKSLDTVYEISQSEIDFRISSTNSIYFSTTLTRKATFSMADKINPSLVYTFEILEAPIPDFTGMYIFKAERLS